MKRIETLDLLVLIRSDLQRAINGDWSGGFINLKLSPDEADVLLDLINFERAMRHPTDIEIEQAIKDMGRVIDAAKNSNHWGELSLMKAITAIKSKLSRPQYFET